MSDVIRLIDLRDELLSVDEVRHAVADPRSGAVALFIGAVRNRDHDLGVEALAYSAHPTVLDQMRAVAESVERKHDVTGLAVVHRVGDLEIGDLAVVAAASSVHRAQAFEACRDLIDELKSTVPIWKHQAFDDGTDQWVGSP